MTRLALPLTALVLALVAASPAARADTGSVRGTVIFVGAPPAERAVRHDTDPACPPGGDPTVVVTHGRLRDVLVRVKNGTMGVHAPPKTPAVIDQRGCAYTPRVVGLVAGQTLLVRNSDRTFHTVHGLVRGHDLWHDAQPAGAPPLVLAEHARPGDVIELRCEVHPWMHAYAVVQDHPYFAVTGADGTFEIAGLPPGTYTLEAWHPVLGTRTLKIVIGRGRKAHVTARLEYDANQR